MSEISGGTAGRASGLVFPLGSWPPCPSLCCCVEARSFLRASPERQLVCSRAWLGLVCWRFTAPTWMHGTFWYRTSALQCCALWPALSRGYWSKLSVVVQLIAVTKINHDNAELISSGLHNLFRESSEPSIGFGISLRIAGC